MKLPLCACLLTGCGAVHFTDPNPPQLFRSVAQYTSAAVPEPVVWLAVLDLFTESGNADACAAAHVWTLQAIHDAMTAVQAPQMELPHADLSPSCAQTADRSLDTSSLEQQLRSAAAAFPSAHVRVVVVYANDIALEVPGTIVDRAGPPTFQPRFNQRYAVPKSRFAPQQAEVDVEGCMAHCDRFFSARPGDLRRWDTTQGCLL